MAYSYGKMFVAKVAFLAKIRTKTLSRKELTSES
jgi:hypothetical protein